MTERDRLLPPLAFATCSLIWGSTFLFIRIGNDTMPPIWAAAIRLGLAALILTPLTRLSGQSLPTGPALRAALQYGFFQFGVNFPLLYYGETAVPSGLTAVIFATIPLSTTLFARAFGLERLSPRKIGGALLGVIGVATIFVGQLRARVPLGPLAAVLGAAVTASLGTVLLKRGPRQSALGVNAVATAIGFVACLVASGLAGEPRRLPATSSAWVSILYLTIAGSVVAFVLMSWLVNRWEASRVSFIALVVPLVAVVLGTLVRHERLTAATVLGSALVLVGVAVGLMPGARAPAAVPHPR